MTDKHDKLVEMALASGAQYHVTTDPGVWLELDAEALAAFAAAAIAAHTAKVLGDVEPVGEVILNYSTHMERCHPDGPMNDVAWLVDAAVPKSGTKLYPAHTVAALAARVAELEKDAAEFSDIAAAMDKVTPQSAQENADLRNVIQAACIDGLPGLARAWAKYFPDHPITIKGIEPAYTTGHCAEHAKPGGCQLHNLHCGWPDCDRRAALAAKGQA